jgi:hypothetical protein
MSTQHPITTQPMTKQHRATPEQWNLIEKYADSISYRCILELRARIELLEATQHAHLDTSRLSEIEREQIRQELSCPAALQPLKIATETTYGTAPIVVPNSSASLTSSPAGSLVERIGSAAILEMAAWLRSEINEWYAADRLEQEANQ